MCISTEDLRKYVVKPCLVSLGQQSTDAENLLLGTSAMASQLGHTLYDTKSKSYGLYGMTAEAHWDLWDHYLVQFPELASQIRGLASQRQFLTAPDNELITNLSYATATAWMYFQYQGACLPYNSTSTTLAHTWLTRFYLPQHPEVKLDAQDANLIQSFIDAFGQHVSHTLPSLAA